MSRTYQVALIGFGNIAEYGHCEALLCNERLSIAAVYDPTEKRLATAKKLIPDCRVHSDINMMFSEQSFDLVVICSPPAFHYDAVMKGLSEKCHIVCEKPLLTNLEQYTRIQDFATLNHRMIYPCHNYKFAPAIQKAKQIIDSGQIGNVRHILMSTIRATHARGCGEWRPDWRREKQIGGGGIVSDHAVHSIYLSIYWLNEAPTEVISTISNSNNRFDTEDMASITLRFRRIPCHIFLSWTGSMRSSEYLIEGDKGSVMIDHEYLIVRHKGRIILKESTDSSGFNNAGHSQWYRKMYQNILEYLEAQDFKPEVFNEAFVAASVVDRVYQSHRIASTIPCREALKRQITLNLRRIYAKTT